MKLKTEQLLRREIKKERNEMASNYLGGEAMSLILMLIIYSLFLSLPNSTPSSYSLSPPSHFVYAHVFFSGLSENQKRLIVAPDDDKPKLVSFFHTFTLKNGCIYCSGTL